MTVGAWAARKVGKASAERRLARLPTSSTGRGDAVPFPFVDRAAIKDKHSNEEINAAIERAPVVDVKLSELHAIQHSVKPARVAQYIEDPALRPPADLHPQARTPVDHPVVLEVDGKKILWDGHHRSTAASLEGRKTIKARLAKL